MTENPLRLIFAGTPAFSALHLEALIDSKHQLLAAYTQPDRRSGRGKKVQASAVKALATEAGIPVHQPVTLKDAAEQDTLAAYAADVMIVVAYGLILPLPVLLAPAAGCLNVHASLLPRWRGAAPIQRAIEAGDAATGITIMQMDEGLDTGAMLATQACPITPQTSAATLHDELAKIGPPLLLKVLDDLSSYRNKQQAQDDSGATYAHKILKSEAPLNWADSASSLDKKIRAFNPFPVCYGVLEGSDNNERVRIWQAQPIATNSTAATAQPATPPGTIIAADDLGIAVSCGEGHLLIERLQLPGGKELGVAQVLAARRDQFSPGKRFQPFSGPSQQTASAN